MPTKGRVTYKLDARTDLLLGYLAHLDGGTKMQVVRSLVNTAARHQAGSLHDAMAKAVQLRKSETAPG